MYDNAICIEWTKVNGSSDFFEFRLANKYTFGHFKLEAGADNYNIDARIINKDNYDLYSLPWGNIEGVYDIY
jgi:hypothetical protein